MHGRDFMEAGAAKKRRREEENVSVDNRSPARRKIRFVPQELAKSGRSPVQILSVKNNALLKSPEPCLDKLNNLRTLKIPKSPKVKSPTSPAIENMGIPNPISVWRILTKAKGAPQDQRALCHTLLREAAELSRTMTKTQTEEEKIESGQTQAAKNAPKSGTNGQTSLMANALKTLKSELNITTPVLAIKLIEQVCKDRQGILRKSKQAIFWCTKCKQAGKVRAWCKVCWGSQICSHGRQKRQCKDCGGSGLCVHGRRKSRCKDCGGSGLCKHRRRKGRCKLCGGTQICQHGRRRTHCKFCGGNGLCLHGRQKSRCKECGTGARLRKSPPECNLRTENSKTATCTVCKKQIENGKCTNCLATQSCKHGIVTFLCDKCMAAPHCTHGMPCTCCIVCAPNADTPNGTAWVLGGSAPPAERVGGLPNICRHRRLKSYCRDCGGSPICKHGRDERYCRECGGSGLCQHNRVAVYCKQCHGDAMCCHGFKTDRCKICPSKIKPRMFVATCTSTGTTPTKSGGASADAVSALLLLSTKDSSPPSTPVKSPLHKLIPQSPPTTAATAAGSPTPSLLHTQQQLSLPLNNHLDPSSLARNAASLAPRLSAAALRPPPALAGTVSRIACVRPKLSPWTANPAQLSMFLAGIDPLATAPRRIPIMEPRGLRYHANSVPGAMPYGRAPIGAAPNVGYSIPISGPYSMMVPTASLALARPPAQVPSALSSMVAAPPSTMALARAARGHLMPSSLMNPRDYMAGPIRPLRLATPGSLSPTPRSLQLRHNQIMTSRLCGFSGLISGHNPAVGTSVPASLLQVFPMVGVKSVKAL